MFPCRLSMIELIFGILMCFISLPPWGALYHNNEFEGRGNYINVFKSPKEAKMIPEALLN